MILQQLLTFSNSKHADATQVLAASVRDAASIATAVLSPMAKVGLLLSGPGSNVDDDRYFIPVPDKGDFIALLLEERPVRTISLQARRSTTDSKNSRGRSIRHGPTSDQLTLLASPGRRPGCNARE